MSSPAAPEPFQHATALVLGCHGVLLRGPSGAGKSMLALELLAMARRKGHWAALVGDDRVELTAYPSGLVASGAPVLAGQIELRGRGIEGERAERQALIRLVVDLVPSGQLERMPEDDAFQTILAGVVVARQPAPAGDLPHQVMLARAALTRLCNGAECPV